MKSKNIDACMRFFGSVAHFVSAPEYTEMIEGNAVESNNTIVLDTIIHDWLHANEWA